MIVDGIELDKPEKQWTNVETKKVQYDLKASNILLSTMSFDKYFFICNLCKVMWNALKVLH